MNDRALVGKCGLYCGACAIFRAQRDNPEYREKLANHFNCSIEEVSCNGCGSLTDQCWGNKCKIVLCLRSKNYSHCYECENYLDQSCDKYSDLTNGYREDGEDIRANMERIRNGEIEKWLEESSIKYRCPTCKKPIIVGNSTCHHCGDKFN